MKTSRIMMVAALLMAALFNVQAFAGEDSPTADLTVTTASQYVWRGQELSRDSLVIQPSATLGYKGFSANLWANLDTNPYTGVPGVDVSSALNETDLTLSYAYDFGPVGLEGGYIYYGLEGINDTQELYISLAGNILLSPTLTIYRDVDHYASWYFLFSLGHSFAFSEMVSLDLGASASYLMSDSADDYPKIDPGGIVTAEEFSAFHDAVLSAGLPITFADYYTIKPFVNFIFPLTSEAEEEMKWRSFDGKTENFWVVGADFSFAF